MSDLYLIFEQFLFNFGAIFYPQDHGRWPDVIDSPARRKHVQVVGHLRRSFLDVVVQGETNGVTQLTESFGDVLLGAFLFQMPQVLLPAVVVEAVIIVMLLKLSFTFILLLCCSFWKTLLCRRQSCIITK